MTTDAFDSADFYSCREDNEVLQDDNIEDAISNRIDALMRMHPDSITVYAFARIPVTEEWKRGAALRLVEHLEEWWSEEHGDPEGSDFPPDARAAMATSARAMVDALCGAVAPWRCRRCGERTYTIDEVRAMGVEVPTAKERSA